MYRVRLQRLGSLLGLLAILMVTLAPTVSQVLASQHRLGDPRVAVADDGHRTQGHYTFTVK